MTHRVQVKSSASAKPQAEQEWAECVLNPIGKVQGSVAFQIKMLLTCIYILTLVFTPRRYLSIWGAYIWNESWNHHSLTLENSNQSRETLALAPLWFWNLTTPVNKHCSESLNFSKRETVNCEIYIKWCKISNCWDALCGVGTRLIPLVVDPLNAHAIPSHDHRYAQSITSAQALSIITPGATTRRFLHCPGKRYHNDERIREEIQAETDRLTGQNKAVSDEPIRLRITSPNVLCASLQLSFR